METIQGQTEQLIAVPSAALYSYCWTSRAIPSGCPISPGFVRSRLVQSRWARSFVPKKGHRPCQY
jgi:hypothetical protein